MKQSVQTLEGKQVPLFALAAILRVRISVNTGVYVSFRVVAYTLRKTHFVIFDKNLNLFA